MDESLKNLDAEIEKAADEKERAMLGRLRDSLSRIQAVSRPGAPKPTAADAERLMGDIYLVKQIALAHNIKPSVC